ncbi:ran-binding protein 3-like isoform X1 [Bufo gargarizans]|uniref:ran-binding protein 3-like isoform X1 n=1 Tax=Bufo gargarizans TaxID=30331 RepID=UPI001CF5359A|nr:ran-binding protein 3-like isoform X1 [Bufo gargarizans]
MRNQQTSIIRQNVFYPEIEPLCDGSRRSDKSQSPKVAMCITAAGRRPRAGVQEQVESGVLHLASQPDCHRDTTLLTQPVTVPEKKDRPIKRHAGDLAINADNSVYPEKRLRSSSFTFRPTQSSTDTDHNVLEKRVRSSSFTVLTSFPPNQPVLKNNVFMPSTLLQEQGSSTRAGNIHPWAVIKPATLPPPPVTVCRDVETDAAAVAATTPENKQHEEKSNPPVSNADEPKSSTGSTCFLDIATRMQLFQQRFMPQKYNVDFVFGENMEKRVISPKRPMASQTSAIKREMPSTRVSCNRNWPYQRRISHRSLIESAAAYTSRPKLKYELDQVDIVTGEESDRNVLQVNCKLFVFNKEKQVWTERGHGYLRLNDTASSGTGQLRSRIVMRNHGNLKLILNSKIFDGMKLERANRKSVRLTATDLADSSVRIFLVQASVKDAARLYAAIHHRLIALKRQRDLEQEPSSPKSEAEEDSHIQLLNSDSEDEDDDEMLLYPSKISDHHQWIRRQPVLYS